jgi:hypothetical protein
MNSLSKYSVFIVFDYNRINLILNQFLGGSALPPLPPMLLKPHALAAPQFIITLYKISNSNKRRINNSK